MKGLLRLSLSERSSFSGVNSWRGMWLVLSLLRSSTGGWVSRTHGGGRLEATPGTPAEWPTLTSSHQL